MKIRFLSALVAVTCLPVAAAEAKKADPAVIVVVDTDRILRDCAACVEAQASLRQQADQIRQRVEQLGKPLDEEAAALRKQIAGKPPTPAQRDRVKALATKQDDAQRELATREQSFNRNRGFVVQQVSVKLTPIIKDAMVANGADIVLDTKVTLTFAPGLDITNQVLATLDKQLAHVSVTAPPPTAPPPAPGR